MPTEQLNILVLAGGESGEREVSLKSAEAIVAGLTRLKHKVSVVDSASGAAPVVSSKSLRSSVTASKCDLVFLALHGGSGEDGTIQALLDQEQISYTGSGSEASQIAMSKPKTKLLAQTLGLTTPAWIELPELPQSNEASLELEERAVEALGLPMIIKPANGGSTVGLTLLKEAGGFASALELATREGGRAMLERYSTGRELTVAVFGSDVWPVVEITPKSGLYDYHDKYTQGASEYTCPANIPDSVTEILQSQSLLIYQALGCRGLARVDYILDESGVGQFLEVNTLPGMTELSLAPMAAKAAGVSFDQLLQKSAVSASWG